ncbi:MAG: hypothetical protein GF308_01340 [Candidatus Heimdallarchaeota archaeon]|nr:hypothetical protein [Candidatus Heimdallarchaeota archaeon]
MNKKLTILSVIVLALLSVSGVLLGVFQPWNSNELIIDYSHNEIFSYPGQTAWLVADIRWSNYQSPIDGTIAVSTSHIIDFNFEVWSNDYSKTVEIFLFPNETHLGDIISVQLSVTTSSEFITRNATIEVVNWSSVIIPEVSQMLHCFTDYLLENHSSYSLGENASLTFMGIIPQFLVVEHYLFRSTSWELTLSRHVTHSPDDWVKIYLRARNAIQPIWAAKISSWGSGNHTLFEITPPESVFR